MLDTGILLSFISASALLALAPGPDNIYVLIQSIAHGSKYGVATVLGLVTGCLVHTSLVAFGVSALINANEYLYLGLKVLGAFYLLYLAYKVFKSKAIITLDAANVPQKSLPQLYKQGFVMNVLNPKVSVFFLAFFPGFLFSTSLTATYQFFILGFLFMGVTFIVFSIIAVLEGVISENLKKHHRTSVLLKWMQIVVFIAIAFFILFSEK